MNTQAQGHIEYAHSNNTPNKHNNGESYTNILRYFIPELITALVLYSLLNLIDSKLIADLQKTSLYATLGVTSTLVHFITKVAEGLSVATIVLCGHYNGRGDLKGVGSSAVTSLWVTAVIGFIISSFLYLAAPLIYSWYGVPEHMIDVGVPFLRLRAIGIFFMFLYFSFIGFLRGIKNTRVPMALFVIGAIFFVFFDWSLIQGRCGFAPCGLQGSAFAFLIQHLVMCSGAIIYLFVNKKMRIYSINLFKSYDTYSMLEILKLGWPVMLDKATIAWARMWLVAMIAPMGEYAIASFSAIKDVSQLAFVPAIAFGQVLTLLISNDAGASNWQAVKINIKKILALAFVAVASVLFIFSLNAHKLISFFDPKGTFTSFAVKAFPIIGALMLFDLLQLILAAALRGAGDVKTVMKVRILSCLFFLVPLSWLFSFIPSQHSFVKFVLLYGTFYFSDGLMSLLYVRRFSGKDWHFSLKKNR